MPFESVPTMKKIEIPAALLAGIYDTELQDLKSQLDVKTLQNQSIAEYIRLFQNEIKKLKSNVEPEPQNSQEEEERHVESLKQTYKMLYTIHCSTPRHCPEVQSFYDYRAQIMMKYSERQQQLERCKKHCYAILNDPETKIEIAKLKEMRGELQKAKNSLLKLKEEEKTLDHKIKEKQQRKKDALNKKQQEVIDVEKAIEKSLNFLHGSIEEEMSKENAELEVQLKRLKKQLRADDDDDDCSTVSSCSEITPTQVPFIHKATMDLESFFKNPNDFPMLITSPVLNRTSVKKVVEGSQPKPSAKLSLNFMDKTSPDSDGPKKARTDERALKPKNSSHRFSQPQQKSPSQSHAQLRQLRSAGLKRKSPAADQSPNIVVPSPVVVTPASDEKQPPVKILRIEKLSALSPQNEIAEQMETNVSDEVIGSSEPKEVPYKPRSLDKELQEVQEDEAMEEKIVRQPSPEDPRDPGTDGMRTEEIVIPATETEDMEMEEDEAAEVEPTPPKLSALEGFEGEMSRQESCTSGMNSIFGDDLDKSLVDFLNNGDNPNGGNDLSFSSDYAPNKTNDFAFEDMSGCFGSSSPMKDDGKSLF